jgi:hypothetical protein
MVGLSLYQMMDLLVGLFFAYGIGAQKLIIIFFVTILSGSYFSTTSIRIRYGIRYRHSNMRKYRGPWKT